MPRAGQFKQDSSRRLSDVVSVGVVTRVFPAGLVDEVIAECGRTEQRHRSLPARTMAYFAVGLALHSDGSYEDVLGLMTDGLAWADADGRAVRLPSKSGISQARERLGSVPLRVLFERVARPLAVAGTAGCWLSGRRMVAIDGMTLDVADTEVNAAEFGRPGVNKGEQSAFPQARVIAIAECGTRAMFDAIVGPYTTGENTLAIELVERLQPGMLLLADRGFCGYPLWDKAQATGADLLWRAKSNMKPRHVETLTDGTWIGELRPGGNAGRHAVAHRVRVIDYSIDDGRSNDNTYRLFTTILDPDDASAVDLAAAYAQRWEIETTFDELKTHQRGPKIVLRSKLVDLVYQEIWGYLCCHYAIRSMMFEAADHAKVDTDRVSFVAALRFARRSISQARDFSPSGS
ncbi:MAG: IS4 family transposase [Ilumatobacteraceae bacterium]